MSATVAPLVDLWYCCSHFVRCLPANWAVDRFRCRSKRCATRRCCADAVRSPRKRRRPNPQSMRPRVACSQLSPVAVALVWRALCDVADVAGDDAIVGVLLPLVALRFAALAAAALAVAVVVDVAVLADGRLWKHSSRVWRVRHANPLPPVCANSRRTCANAQRSACHPANMDGRCLSFWVAATVQRPCW